MMYQVQITQRAERDLQEALDYISDTLHNPAAALHLFDETSKQLQSLSDFPDRNPLVRDTFLAANGIRIQLIENYIAVYMIHEPTNAVIILRFLHSRRNWITILKNEM